MDMDLVPSCKEKLAYFRIKELKDVLTQLGLSKQGKKQDLVDRILTIITDEQVSKMWAQKNAVSKEQVAKLVDDAYRKMQIAGGATDLASKGQGASDTSSTVKIKGEIEDSFQSDTKIRCLCGSTLETEPLVKCDDPKCHVWQHISCVIIPEKPIEGIPPVPDKFYCELCRLSRADPFWVSVVHPLFPVKLTTTSISADGTNPVQSLERTFQLTRADKDLVSKQEFDVQAWCMLLNDKVSFRMQWPQYTDLQVNGVPVRAINRPGSQLLGANGRDDGPIITPYTKDGINKIYLTGCDARVFCLGVRIVKRRSVQQVLNIIPKEPDGELFEDALARVCRCVGGGNADDNADSDSDLEVVSDNFTINLRCPVMPSYNELF
ncbi:putative chromatin regulator PHD family [Lupinus albus]|uniref:Putative chromatin regulator PHD family n=1 Tax=Lupinus albus TaxID=3870 RepID=A0A6A4NVN7_LUPAL|nr:putative chromatin regulator PHD family [Lupinus albus]